LALLRSVPSAEVEMPGTRASTSLMLVRFSSSMRCWVITLTDCGVSRTLSARPVATPLGPRAV